MRRRTGDRAPRRDARALPRGGRARERRPQRVHARDARARTDAATSTRSLAVLSRRSATGRSPDLFSLHRRAPSSRTRRTPFARSTRAGKMATIDVLGEETADSARDGHDRRGLRGGAGRDRPPPPRREHQRQADGARARPRLRPVQASPAAARSPRARAGQLRPHRHGGRDDDRCDPRDVPPAPCRRL